jgi:hypothetical protein
VATSEIEGLVASPESREAPRKNGTKVTVGARSKQSVTLKIRNSAVN